MFRWLLDRSPALFSFLSGVFVSFSTNALAAFALAEKTPGNWEKIIRSAAVTFGAAIAWFLLGELISASKRRVAANQEGIGGSREHAYAKALEVVGRTEGWKLYLLLFLAVILSILWPLI